MKLSKRHFDDQALNEYFIRDNENYFLKHNGTENSLDVEEGVEDAQIFSLEDATDIISLNPDRDFELVRVKELINEDEYDLIESE